MKRLLIATITLTVTLPALAAGQYPDPSGVNPLAISADSELYVMNGRLGSRHFLGLDPGHGKADLGAMGFDPSVRLPLEARHQRRVGIEVMLNNFSLYGGGPLLLQDRTLGLGLTYTCATGTDPSGLILSHCVISPMAFARSLDDEQNLKTAIAPFFYHTLTVTNPGDVPLSAEVVLTMDGRGRLTRTRDDGVMVIELYEGRSNRFSCKPPVQALAAAGRDAWIVSGDRNGFIFNLDLGPGEETARTVIQASHTGEPVIKSAAIKKKSRFYYARFFDDVDAVISWALAEKDGILGRTARTESLLADADLSPERKWLMALTFHTYLCNTWLVEDESGRAGFYVWEGDYAMQSTVDVAHEVEVLACFMPWTLELQLRQWAGNVLESKWGPYIAHDVGRDQVVDKPWYERPANALVGLPPMPVEENANFALLMHWHHYLTGDMDTLKELLPTMERMLLASMDRDLDGNGIADRDTGTTYDVSDALHVAPNNVYLGIKQMSAYLVGADLLEKGGRPENAATLRAEAAKILETITNAYNQYGYLPTALDTSYSGWDQASVVLGDGLLYPSLTGFRTPEIEALIPILAESFEHALPRSQRSYGVVMTEGEGVIFFSKVMVMEPVSLYMYGSPTELWQGPYQWNQNNDKAYNDGAYSADKDWSGYKYCRGVISMWPLIPPP